MNIQALYEQFKSSSGVATDTREEVNNRIFFCLSGERFNGNRFAEDALQKGAEWVIGDDPLVLPKNKRIVCVPNALKTLQQLAHHHRMQFDIPVLAITGSNGKTTCKELFRSVLNEKYKVHATQGNLNNHIGVPLTLLKITAKINFAIIEMGANHQGEIATLAEIAAPNFGYITNFGKAHLEGFGGVEGVIKGKSELYTYLRKTNGTVLVQGSNTKQLEKSEGIKRFTFGESECNTFRITIGKNKQGYGFATWADQKATSQLTGEYNQINIAAALAMGLLFEVPAKKIVQGIGSYLPKNNRSQWIHTAKNKLLLDAYNANPSSMQAALEAFSELEAPAKGVILGDMLELGDFAAKEHQNIVDSLCETSWSPIFLVGPLFCQTSIGQHIMVFQTTQELKTYLSNKGLTHKTLLLKGSRGIALEQLLDQL